MSKRFDFVGVQMDLARQMEPIEKIKEFIDFISANGYNVLFLYLEGRLSTATFPFPNEHESYTPEQMKDIVAYASNKNIDVLPGLSCFGHAELFLQYKELNEIAELRDGRNGRFWNNKKQVFCPSQKTTLNFLKKYLTEICEIFPSKYIHIGMDEVWDIGYCKKCKQKAKKFKGEQNLFLDIIKFCHNILSQKLNRVVMMWDDMFEFYPDILQKVPRDIIMVSWQYQLDVQQIRGHFANLKAEKTLEKYERLGIDYIIAPTTFSTANVRTFTQYVENLNPIGGLLTNWENAYSYIHKYLPLIAYAGLLWSNKTEESEKNIFKEAIKSLFGFYDDSFLALMRCYCESGILKEDIISEAQILTTPYSGLDYGMQERLNWMKLSFEHATKKVKTELGQQICNDISLAIFFNILKFRLKDNVRKLFSKNNLALVEKEFNDISSSMEKLSKIRVKEWDDFRADIIPCKYKDMYQNNIDMIRSFSQLEQTHGKMYVRFCLPDQDSAEYCKISLLYNKEWIQIATGPFKPVDSKEPFYKILFLVNKTKVPEAVCFECCGYGGAGIAYLKIINDSGIFIPEKILSMDGEVINPEFVLDDDCKWCFIGEKNTLLAFRQRNLAEAKHCIIYKLKISQKLEYLNEKF